MHAQSCPTLCQPVDCSSPGSSVHGISQARILEWVAISFSRGSCWPRGWTHISCIAGRFFTTELMGKPLQKTRIFCKYLWSEFVYRWSGDGNTVKSHFMWSRSCLQWIFYYLSLSPELWSPYLPPLPHFYNVLTWDFLVNIAGSNPYRHLKSLLGLIQILKDYMVSSHLWFILLFLMMSFSLWTASL